MPELPEVEIVKRGLVHEIGVDAKIVKFEFRRANLRHQIPAAKLKKLEGERILSIERRAKYLLFTTQTAGFVSHLGMTGTWRILQTEGNLKQELNKHDHILLHLKTKIGQIKILVYRDPRRFGVFDFWARESEKLPWGGDLGPEPLSHEFSAEKLFRLSRGRKVPIKTFIMNQKVVVGVGNIYASESLFLSGIRPTRFAANISKRESQKLVQCIRQVLQKAIDMGGSSISDFYAFNGKKGEFHLQHFVYDRKGQACRKCHSTIRAQILGGRNSFWCPGCQG